MGKFKEAIGHLTDAGYARGMDGAKMARRLIEAGLAMMIDEGEITTSNRIVPNEDLDGSFHVSTFTSGVSSDALADAHAALEVAGQQFLFYSGQHFDKGTPESELKGHVNLKLADMCFNETGATTQRRPVQLAAGAPVTAHLPELAAIAGGAIPAAVLESAQEAAQEPRQAVSKARSSDGTLALSVAPCRAEIVAWVMSKAEKAKKDGMEDVFFVLQALAGEIEQHLEERQVNVAHALHQFYADCHARNVKAGWWTDLATGIAKKRSVGELFMLFVTEIEEAYQAYIDGSADDKLPQYPGLGVELGDLQIRLADFAGAMIAGSLVTYDPNVNNPGDQMFREVCEIARRYESIRKTDAAVGQPETGDFIPGVDVAEMVVAKLEYNANRPDHKIENRLKEDGKRT